MPDLHIERFRQALLELIQAGAETVGRVARWQLQARLRRLFRSYFHRPHLLPNQGRPKTGMK